MIQKYSRYKILQVFFDFPRKNFQIRELVRIVGISQPSVTNHIAELVKEGFVLKREEGIYPSYVANREFDKFKLYKKTNIIHRIYSSGLLDFIYDSCVPSSVVLFGSCAKGEDIEESDVDIFVQASGKKLDLVKYEKILKRDINIFFEPDFSKLNKELKNNILNGCLLKGYLKVF